MQRPLIRPCAYSILILLFTIITTAVFISPLLLFYYSYCHKTVTTDKLLRASLFPGAAELTTPLLRLTSILCLPLCRINKLGNTSLEDCCDPLYLWVIRDKALSEQNISSKAEELKRLFLCKPASPSLDFFIALAVIAFILITLLLSCK